MDASQHVARLFLRDLGRQADPAGQAFWESRAKEVSPAQLNVEFREAAKKENPQAGQPRGTGMGMGVDPYSRIALPGEEGYRPDRNLNFFQQLAPFIVPIIGAVAPALLPAIGSALGATGAAAAAVGAVGSPVKSGLIFCNCTYDWDANGIHAFVLLYAEITSLALSYQSWPKIGCTGAVELAKFSSKYT